MIPRINEKRGATMKRRIISVLLLIVMLISLVPAQAFAQETTADDPETLPEARQIPAEETIPDEEVEIIPMPDAEYEEIIEEPENETTSNQIENVDGYSANNVHVKGTDEELYFNSTSAIKEVYISGRWIDPANYSLSTDGKMLTLNAAFLNQLAYGSYTMQIGCTNGSAVTCVFNIVATIIASGSCGENLTWTLDENGVLTISGTGAMADYDAYSWTLNNTVVSNNAPWYSKYIEQIIAVVIEPGVTSIGEAAFWSCTALTSVTIPNSVTSIGREAFSNCHALTSMTIHDDVTNIGEAAFFYCKALTSIEVASNNEHYSSVDGILFNKDATELVCYPGGRTGSYTISESVNSVCNYAFSGCASLTSVTIPDSVTSIGKQTFRGCTALTDVTIPDRVTSIGDYAFWDCTALTSVTIPDSVTSIGDAAFSECSGLSKITSLAGIPPVFDRCMFVGEEFGEVNKANCELIVPEESITAYKQAKGWNEFSNIRGFVGEKK